jgi:Flp pilus assembly protein TadD
MGLRALVFAAALTAPAAAAADLPALVLPVKDAIREEKWDAAVAAGERAVKEMPKNSSAHLWLGKAYGQKAIRASVFSQFGWAKKCRSEFEKAVSLDPMSVEARGDLVQFYASAPGIVGGGMDKAREQVRAIDSLDPARGAAMNGYVLSRENKKAEAEAEFRRALSLKPEDAYLHWRLGRFLESVGRKDEARASYCEALRLDPTHDNARKDLLRLEASSSPN